MAANDRFERENQSLALSSCGATIASLVLAVIAIVVTFPHQYPAKLETAISFLKIIFFFSIACSVLGVFSYLTREFKETVSDVLLYFSVIALITTMLFLIPMVYIFM